VRPRKERLVSHPVAAEEHHLAGLLLLGFSGNLSHTAIYKHKLFALMRLGSCCLAGCQVLPIFLEIRIQEVKRVLLLGLPLAERNSFEEPLLLGGARFKELQHLEILSTHLRECLIQEDSMCKEVFFERVDAGCIDPEHAARLLVLKRYHGFAALLSLLDSR
jgi:hypothetical protein